MSVGPLDTLNIILTGMTAAQAQTDVAGQNIANASNPNYAVETVDQAPLLGPPAPMATGLVGPGAFGGGVDITGVTRQAPAFLSATARQASAASTYASTVATALQNAQTIFQEPSSNGIAALMEQFFSDLTALSQDPSNIGAKAAVVGAAQTLVQAFHTVATGLIQAQTNVMTQLNDTVASDNTILGQVAQLDGQIQQLEIAGENPNALLDQRSGLLDQLAKDLGATVQVVNLTDASGQPVRNPDGQPVTTIRVMLPDGTMLVDGTVASTLSVAAGPPPTVQVTGPGGSPVTPAWGSGQWGTVGGLLALVGSSGLLSGDGPSSYSGSWLNQLDQVAAGLAAAINPLQTGGYAPNPTTGVMTQQTSTPFFEADLSGTLTASGPFTAANLVVNPTLVNTPSLVAAAATPSPNDGSNAAQMALVGSNSSGPLAQYQQMIAAIGSEVQSAQQVDTTLKAVAAQAQQAREAVSGVSINEEVVHISFASQTYQALAKTMATLQAMVAALLDSVQ